MDKSTIELNGKKYNMVDGYIVTQTSLICGICTTLWQLNGHNYILCDGQIVKV